jgi:ubiquinone/menaquinone biosynthesis C-methylase UbiE
MIEKILVHMDVEKKEGWTNPEAAERYAQTADIIIPERKEILSIIARLAIELGPINPEIIDLGCGLGDVTAEILGLKPDANVLMIDFSDEMIKRSSERFKGNKNITVVKKDLNQGILDITEDRVFDVVVSCFAIHHVEFDNRIKLYSDIYAVLNEKGLFINGDLFKEDSPVIDNWEFNNHISSMVVQLREKLGQKWTFDELKLNRLEDAQKMGDKPGTLWQMYHDMKAAGFRYVDCLWKSRNLAIMAATK